VGDGDGRRRGVLYLDAFARRGKLGGGWMDAYADPAPLLGRLPLVSLKLNVTPPAPGAPALLTLLDVRILFHEFGHGLHVVLSDVHYPRVAGINVPEDVVEFPAKFHEALGFHPEVLAAYARHHATGEPLDAADAAALEPADRDGAAYRTAQGVANALLDQAWHGLAPGDVIAPDDVDAFEDAVLEEHGLDLAAVGFNYRSSFFRHVFDGPYPGTHYSYLWAAALEAVALDWLADQGGPTRTAGDRLRRGVLARGGVVDPIEALETITGRRPSTGPLLARRGLVGPR
jgi:peptidyl-dipeptidase Dcp